MSHGHCITASPVLRLTICPRFSPLLVNLNISGNHQKTIQFHIFNSAIFPLVLGHSWLSKQTPHIVWPDGAVMSWSLSCHVECLVFAVPAVSSVSVLQDEPGDFGFS